MQSVDVVRVAMRGPADMSALAALIDQGRVDPANTVAVLGKTEGNGCVNDFTRELASMSIAGSRHTMLTDSDINSTRHARAAVGGVIASMAGHTAVYVSGGAEHQGPAGGGPIALISRVD